MISKDESIEIFFKYYDEFSENERAEQMYDDIKYSIGTCGECSWLEKDTGKSYYDCIQIGIRLMPDRCNNFFCADFERKEQ